MNDTSSRGLKFLYFLIGITLPLAGILMWSNPGSKKRRVDKAHDITVEDSFPASDPPSAW